MVTDYASSDQILNVKFKENNYIYVIRYIISKIILINHIKAYSWVKHEHNKNVYNWNWKSLLEYLVTFGKYQISFLLNTCIFLNDC